MICHNCKKEFTKGIRQEPNRHMTSPNSINYRVKDEQDKYYEYFCSEVCRQTTNKARYKFFAELDRNASDSECFVHEAWKTDDIGRKIRIGHCKITKKHVEVEPLQPGNNSGQPIECYEHFILRESYRA